METKFSHNGLGDVVPIVLTPEQRQEILKIQNASPILVFYGFAKLTPKIVRKRSIVIFFENSRVWTKKKEKYIRQKMEIIHVRVQTAEEENDAYSKNREWHRYEIFVDEKPYRGNLELALERNFVADKHNVSEFELNVIRNKLRNDYYKFYNLSGPVGQSALIFD